jgi:hypothetical protein
VSRWTVIGHERLPDHLSAGAAQVAPSPSEPSPLEAASEQLAQARAAALRFDHDAALAAASRAQEILESHIQGQQAHAMLHQALAMRALFESNLEEGEASLRSLERAARLDPEAELDPALFPPDLLERYAAIAGRVRSEPPASISVTTEPSGARVELDGRDIGESPTSAHARSGAHFVAATALGYEARVLAVRITDEGTPPLELALPAASRDRVASQVLALDESDLEGLTLPGRQLLSARLDADVLLRVDAGRVIALSLLDTRSQRGALGEEGVRPIVERLFHDPADDVLGSGWFWLGIGLVVAAAVAVPVAAVLYEPPQVLRVDSL